MRSRAFGEFVSARVARLIALWLLAIGTASAAGLQAYADLVRADPLPVHVVPPASGVRITYLGTNGYLLEARDTTLLVDPYFSRQSLARAAFNLDAVPQPKLVDQWLRQHPHIDAVLVTHGHVDHLLDVPQILRTTDAQMIGSETSVRLVRSMNIAGAHLHAVRYGDKLHVRQATVDVLPAKHDRVLGSVPFNGRARNLPPRKVGDWVAGEPLAFLIQLGGKRIFINAGAGPGAPEIRARDIDLAILGVATPDSVRAFPAEVDQLHPRFVLPSHQDNFFQPLARGFSFLPLTNFPAVRAAANARRTELVLLDYFRPWTLR